MAKLFSIIFLLLACSLLYADFEVTAYAVSSKDEPAIPPQAANKSVTDLVPGLFITPSQRDVNNHTKMLYEKDEDDVMMPLVGGSEFIRINLWEKQAKVDPNKPKSKLDTDIEYEYVQLNPYKAGIRKVVFTSMSNPKSTWPDKVLAGASSIAITNQRIIPNLNAPVFDTIRVELVDDKDAVVMTRYYKYWEVFALYRAFNIDTFGLYVPLGLMSVTQADKGLVLASLPVGIAWGMKFYIINNFFIGVTPLMACWLVTPETDPAKTGTFVLSAASFGGYIDINDLLVVGVAYGHRFDGGTDPGFMLIFGLGTKLMGIFNTK